MKPQFFAIFGIEDLLDLDSCRAPILFIFRAYIDKLISKYNAEMLCSMLVKDQNKKKQILDFYYQNQSGFYNDNSNGQTSSTLSIRASVRPNCNSSIERGSDYSSSKSSFLCQANRLSQSSGLFTKKETGN